MKTVADAPVRPASILGIPGAFKESNNTRLRIAEALEFIIRVL